MDSTKRPPLGEFLPPIAIPPSSSPHKSTIIFLHGRGSNAGKFHGPLLSTPLSKHGSFRDALPHVKFVFPTAPLMRATKYRRSIIHQWYDGSGDWEPEVRGYMRSSAEHILGIIQHEIELLGGDSNRIVLAGISQGCAMSITSMLLWDGDALGAVVGMCGFMPMAAHFTRILDEEQGGAGEDDGIVFESESDIAASDSATGQEHEDILPAQKVVAELREEVELPRNTSQISSLSCLSTPVFLGHGTVDENVEYHHGQKAAEFLEKMGLEVEFRTYDGLGHWYSQEMLEHIIAFLSSRVDV